MAYMDRGSSAGAARDARAPVDDRRPAPGRQTRVGLGDAPEAAQASPGARTASAAGRPAGDDQARPGIASLFGGGGGGGGGKAMPADVRAKMEASLGADFSAVRIHEGAQASDLGALAYAQGSDIYFAPGQYDPTSPRGQELLGHELTHVVQQAQGRVPVTAQARGAAWNADAALEHEADLLGGRAARGEPAHTGGVVTPAARSTQAPVQARLPDRSYTQEVRKHEPQHDRSNLQGLQNLLVRIYTHELTPLDQQRLKEACARANVNLLEAIYREPSELTAHAYNHTCHLFPQLSYPGHNVSREPTDKHEHENRVLLVAGVRQVLAWMASSSSDAALLAVFGRSHVEAARERTVHAKRWADDEQFPISIGIDRTGESDEMMIGGHASFKSAITLRPGAFASPPTLDLIANVTHELFHAANHDVLDNGGYPDAREAFKQRSGDEKILNASHYEEVARRFLDAAPVGGAFVPAVREQRAEDGTVTRVDHRTPIERATQRVRSAVQLAWERCQNVHGFMKAYVHQSYEIDRIDERMATDIVTPAVRWSVHLHLQLHERVRDSMPKCLTINYLDLLQVETLTKTLGQMMSLDLQALLPQTPILAQRALNLDDERFAALIADSLLNVLVSRYSDARWLKPGDFVTIVQTLKDAPRDVSKIER